MIKTTEYSYIDHNEIKHNIYRDGRHFSGLEVATEIITRWWPFLFRQFCLWAHNVGKAYSMGVGH